MRAAIPGVGFHATLVRQNSRFAARVDQSTFDIIDTEKKSLSSDMTSLKIIEMTEKEEDVFYEFAMQLAQEAAQVKKENKLSFFREFSFMEFFFIFE